MEDCSFSLAHCTENQCFPTLYYVLVGFNILGIPLSDISKSMVKRKANGHALIIKLLLSLWLLLRIIYNYYVHNEVFYVLTSICNISTFNIFFSELLSKINALSTLRF